MNADSINSSDSLFSLLGNPLHFLILILFLLVVVLLLFRIYLVGFIRRHFEYVSLIMEFNKGKRLYCSKFKVSHIGIEIEFSPLSEESPADKSTEHSINAKCDVKGMSKN